jgi:hypothetical protein
MYLLLLSTLCPDSFEDVHKTGGKPILNPENNLILAPTDRIVYMSRKRFDWLKNNGQILQHIHKMS